MRIPWAVPTRLSLFWRYFRSYLLISTFLFLALFFSFNGFRRELITESERSAIAQFREVQRVVDSSVLEARSAAIELSLQPTLLAVPYSIDAAYLNVIELTELLTVYESFNDTILGMTVYFFENELFVQSAAASGRFDTFYAANLGFEDISYAQWKSRVLDASSSEFFLLQQNVINANTGSPFPLTYVMRFPSVATPSTLRGVIMLHLDIARLVRRLDFGVLGDTGAFHIADSEGNTIAASNRGSGLTGQPAARRLSAGEVLSGYVEEAGERFLRLHIGSAVSGWHYLVHVPNSALLTRIIVLQRGFAILFAIAIAVVIGLAFYLSERSIAPIKEIVGLLPELAQDQRSDTLAFIRESIVSLRDEVRFQKELMESEMLSMLVSGKIGSDDEIEAYLPRTSLELPTRGRFRLAIARTAFPEKDANQARAVLVSALRQLFAKRSITQSIDSRQIATIVFGDTLNDDDAIGRSLSALSERMAERYGGTVLFVISDEYERIINTPIAYAETNALRDYLVGSDHVIWSERSDEPAGGYFFPAEVESHLSTLLRLGERDELLSVVGGLRNRNAGISGQAAWFFQQDLITSLYKVFPECLPEDSVEAYVRELASLHREPSVDSLFTRLSGLLERVCDTVVQAANSLDQRRVSDAVQYIERNYADPNLNLYSVAAPLNLGEKTLSRLFKEHVGETFSSYVENLRLQKAATVMSASDETLESIASRVGYQNYNTFHKAFRRRFSKSPGEYRRST